MKVVFPQLKDLVEFKEALVLYGHPHLPPLDDRWPSDMLAMFELVQLLPGRTQDLSLAAAHLFFKIIKNHRRPDGNKRSALCCYIFLLTMNGKQTLVPGDELEELAVMVASSQGNSEEELLPMLQDLFSVRMTTL